MIMDTLNLSTITYTQNVQKRVNPTPTTITADPSQKFMFGIEIWRQNLSESVRYFDVTASLYAENAGVGDPITLPLVQCTRDHWVSLPDVIANF